MKKCLIMLLGGAITVSSCSTGAGTGAYAGGSMGSVLGSAIGGIVGGPRGHDIGTVIGMATGAAAGAAVGDAAEKKQRQSVGVPAEEQQQRRPSEREMRARRNQRIQREKAMQRQRQQMQQNDAEYDDDVYFDAKKPREIDAKKLRTYDAEEPGKPERPMPFYNNEGFPEGQHFKLERIPRRQIDNNVQEEQPQESRLDTDIVVDETNSSDDSFDFEKGE